MDISSLNSAHLKSLVALVEKREAAQAEVDRLTAEIFEALGGKVTKEKVPAAGAKRRPKKGRPKMNKRGALKEFILKELEAAGSAGVAVKELSERLGVKNQNVHVWFASTGKSLGAKKIGRGRYAL